MTLIQIYDSELPIEFKAFLDQIKPNVEAYAEAKGKAQFERMMIIGKIKDYQTQFPQRSYQHKALAKAMKSEGWSEDVIHNTYLAYEGYNGLLQYHESLHIDKIIKLASVSHLTEISKGVDVFELLKYIRRHKKLPPVSALRGRLGGFFDQTFQPLSRFRTDWSRKPNESTNYDTEDLHPVDVEVVTEPTSTTDESLPKTQEELIDQLITLVQLLNLDLIYRDDDLKSKLTAVKNQLMCVAHLAIPTPCPIKN